MQPVPVPAPAPVPAAPAAPTPAAARATGVLLPDGPLPLGEIPRSESQLRGLRARRDVLKDQLDRASNRRDALVRELNGEGRSRPQEEARVGIQRRIDLLDERILQIERDQAMTERLLAATPAEVLASSQQRREQPGTMSEDDAAGGMFGTFIVGVVLTLIVGRFRRRRKAKLGVKTASTQALAEDPRFAELSQAVGAIAEEVERIGEGQRFVTQLLSQRERERDRAIVEPRG